MACIAPYVSKYTGDMSRSFLSHCVMPGLLSLFRRLKELGWPVNPDLATFLEGIVQKEQERRQALSDWQTRGPMLAQTSEAAGTAGSGSATADSSNCRSEEDAVPAAPAERLAAEPPGILEAAASAATAPQPPPVARPAGAGIAASGAAGSSALLEGLPASVLARLPHSALARQPVAGCRAALAADTSGLEWARSTSLESEVLSRFSSIESDAMLNRFSSLSSVESHSDAQHRSFQVLLLPFYPELLA